MHVLCYLVQSFITVSFVCQMCPRYWQIGFLSGYSASLIPSLVHSTVNLCFVLVETQTHGFGYRGQGFQCLVNSSLPLARFFFGYVNGIHKNFAFGALLHEFPHQHIVVEDEQ